MKTTVTMEIKTKQEIFSHKDDDGTYRSFMIGTMNEFAEKHGHSCSEIVPAELSIEKVIVEHIQKNMGIERPRVDRLVSPWLEKPLLGIFWHDNITMTIIDGNHRIIKLSETGGTEFKIYIFRHPFWEQFLVPIPPERAEEMMGQPSRMPL